MTIPQLGFFYNIPATLYPHKNLIVVGYNVHHLVFKSFSRTLLPRNIWFSNMNYNSFDYPVLYEEDSQGQINYITFLKDIPIVNDYEHKGYSILDKHQITLLYNGQDIYSNIQPSISKAFYNLVLRFHVANIKVLSIQSDINNFGSFDYLLSYVENLKSYINTINIIDILSDLEVCVHDHCHFKIGGDDSYSISRKASVSNPIANNDEYLKHIIGIGDICIYRDSGYTSAYSLKLDAEDFLKDHPLGDYSGKLLENEKKRIISLYSKEAHLGYLFAKQISKIHLNEKYDLPDKIKIVQRIRKELFEDFRLSSIENTDRKFERNFYPLRGDSKGATKEFLDQINSKILNDVIYKNINLTFHL